MNDSFKRIGNQLQVARKERGLRLVDVARELRISADYLKLLEFGDFEQLPAPAYVSGFLRSYGKFLGLDGSDLAGRFYAIQGDASSSMDYKLPVTAGPPQRSAPAVASLFVVLALVGYGGWYWMSGPATPTLDAESELAVSEIDRKPGQMEKNAIGQRLEFSAGSKSGSPPSDVDAKVLLAKNAEEATQTEKKFGGDTAGAPKILEGSPASAANPASLPSDIDTSSSDEAPEQVLTPDAASPSGNMMANIENDDDTLGLSDIGQQFESGRGAAVAKLRDPDQEVTIRATASSWVEIVRGDGTAVLKKLMKTGETHVVDNGNGLYLSTGNAGGIELLTSGDDIITIGTIGEIVRDLPLAKNRLRERF